MVIRNKVYIVDPEGQEDTKDDGVDAQWLAWVEGRFSAHGVQDTMDKETFVKVVGTQKSTSFFAERLFTLIGKGQTEILTDDVISRLRKLISATKEEKLQFLFNVYDVDGNGTIDPAELRTVLVNCMEESCLQLTDDDVDALTMALFDSADDDHDGRISFDELLRELNSHPAVLANFTISTFGRFKPNLKTTKARPLSRWTRYSDRRYYINNSKKVIFLTLYSLLNIALFISSLLRYKHTNAFIMLARGCGMCLNFNCAFILMFMLRTCLTLLRSTRAATYLPLDNAIAIHKTVGIVILVQSLVHTAAHLANLNVVATSAATLSQNSTMAVPLQYWEYLFTLRSGVGWIGPGFGYLSGVILLVLLALMVLSSLPVVRKSGHFQVFYWTHQLCVPFWVLCILHGPIFWYFFIVPGLLYLYEIIHRNQVMKYARYGKIYVDYVHLLPSKVIKLVVAKPEKFQYTAGDFIFLKVPGIARHEWHPFTISSAPELKDEYWLHIRAVGHWTKKLYTYCDEKLQENLHETVTDKQTRFSGMSVKRKSKISGEVELRKFDGWASDPKAIHRIVQEKIREGPLRFEVLVDGPYGTPSRQIFDTEHVVLIASGIGVTPYAAILQSIMFKYQATKVTCPKCQHCWFRLENYKLKIKKVDFIWINRDQRSFEWFIRLLTQLEIQQTKVEAEKADDPFLEMQLYMTAAASVNDMKGLGLHMALEIMHKRGNRDLITGLQTKTHAGRPNWQKVFQCIKDKNSGKVGVFFCGSPSLSSTLRELSGQFGFSYSKENF